MQTIIRLFLQGLATLVPIALTLVILVWFIRIAEQGMGAVITWLLPEWLYLPGMGLLAGVGLVIGVGVLSRIWLFQRLIDVSENLLNYLPLVKTVYRAIKDFVDYFSPGEAEESRKVVKVSFPGQPVTLIGFITREDFSQLPFGEPGEVAVYLPLSYQIGGYTLILPADWLEPVDMPFEDAMRLVLTAGVSRRANDNGQGGR